MKIYNYCVDQLCLSNSSPSKEAKIKSKYKLRELAKKRFGAEIQDVNMPNTSLEYAVFEAFQANKAGKNLQYRQDKAFSIAIDGRNIKNGYIYKNNTAKQLRKLINSQRSITGIMEDNKLSALDGFSCSQVCRLVYKFKSGQFSLIRPVTIAKPEKPPKRDAISLDPGIRTFLAYYDGRYCGEIGNNIHVKIKRLNKEADKIQSKIDCELRYYRRAKLIKAKAKIQNKIDNIVSDLHKKACNFLTKYKYILLPEFKTKKMLRGLNRHSSRSLQNLSHFAFKMRLIQKSCETGSKVVICNEAYTSKTCTLCGNINKDLGNKKTYHCDNCDLIIDRDINGARNVLLRVLRGGSFQSPD